MNLLKNSENVIVFHVEKSGESLEEFLFNNKISGRFFRRLYRGKNVFINGVFKRKDNLLKEGDIVSIRMVDEVENILPEPIPLDIIYEDVDLLVINKQPYTVVHQTKSHQKNTISNGISYYFKTKGINKKIRFINRLDMDTSGILLVAKSPFAHQQMALQFENNEVEKKYMVVVAGVVEKDQGIIDLPIGREEEQSIKKTVTPKGKDALTKYKVLERYKETSLLDVQILTGRSHQIRVHLSHIGHPIIGDTLYYEPSEYIERQALHSHYLKAKLPRSKEIIEFKAPLPKDIVNLINHLNDS
ncbi:RluA family pseudouridine synthase [Clostridium sp. Cult2]|uniref:RluA family pseudouridine synthase n=1 Tax=Clostridium sp. Cult2 TaxID=2079003 RepID=UPI001F43FCD9|nr:RluA family pseudouridine synthase [Clostridium sp. Cult2]MCF6466696.1 RluA family pseudouridine synthase [Clostridium sp. Cult2]